MLVLLNPSKNGQKMTTTSFSGINLLGIDNIGEITQSIRYVKILLWIKWTANAISPIACCRAVELELKFQAPASGI